MQGTFNGVTLSYDVRGEGEPVLFVCGTGQAAATWEMFGRAPLDEAGYRTITFDNRGIPPSECPPPPYSVAEMANDAIALMEHLGWAPYRVIGASLGGMIVQTVALRRPDLVRAAVLLVGGGNVSAYERLRMRIAVELLQSGNPLADDFFKVELLDAMLAPALRQDDAAVDNALVMSAMFESPSREGQLGQLAADLAWAEEDHLSELAGMQVPCLVIANEHDHIFPPVLLRQAADRIPQSEYVEVPGEPHVGLSPVAIDKVSSTMVDFLARH